MLKRGQITVFLVVGIVILLLSAILFYVLSKGTTEPLKTEAEETTKALGIPGAVQLFVEDCLQQTIDPSIYLLAKQGGVIYPDEENPILLTDHGLVNYAWLNGEEGISQEKMEADLATYVEENIDLCFAGFASFTDQGIQVIPEYDEMDVEVSIQDSAINLEMNLPLEIILPSNDIQSLTSFRVQKQSVLGEMTDTITSLQFPDLGPEDFQDVPYQPTIMPYDESVVIYSLSRNDPQEPLQFLFAIRNDYPENKPPQLDFISDKSFSIGDLWQQELSADDPNHDFLSFSSDSSLFPVEDDGSIDLILSLPGIFDVTFMVEDGRGGKDQQEVSILVRE